MAAALPLWSEGGTQSTEITSSSHDDDDDEPLFIQCLPGRIAFLPRGHPSAQIFEAEIFFRLDDIGFYLFDSFVSKFDFLAGTQLRRGRVSQKKSFVILK